MSMSGVVARAPSARGRREKATLIGAMKMWRCFEYAMKTMKPEMTAMFRIRKTVASTALVPAPSGARISATACEAKVLHPV